MSARGIFFEEDDALAVVARLRRDGYEAHLAREPFAGEDDDEGHPWAVRTDAPEVALDLLTDEYDGWLDHDDARAASGPVPPPLVLPVAPKRIKRPDLGNG